jgi:DNA-binding MarR family transcriptional regulator
MPTPLARLVGQRRARILEALREAKTTGQTADSTGIAISTASEHLHELVLARVVERQRSGRFVYYVLSEFGQRLVNELAPRPPVPPY